MVILVAVLGILGAACCALWAIGKIGASQELADNAALARRLGLRLREDRGTSFSGAARGLCVDLIAGGGSDPGPFVEIGVQFEPCPVWISFRRTRRGYSADTSGELEDCWAIEGAPARLVRELLSDEELRAELLALAGLGGTAVEVRRGKLTIHREGPWIDRREIRPIQLAMDLAESIRALSHSSRPTPEELAAVEALEERQEATEWRHIHLQCIVIHSILPTLFALIAFIPDVSRDDLTCFVLAQALISGGYASQFKTWQASPQGWKVATLACILGGWLVIALVVLGASP